MRRRKRTKHTEETPLQSQAEEIPITVEEEEPQVHGVCWRFERSPAGSGTVQYDVCIPESVLRQYTVRRHEPELQDEVSQKTLMRFHAVRQGLV